MPVRKWMQALERSIHLSIVLQRLVRWSNKLYVLKIQVASKRICWGVAIFPDEKKVWILDFWFRDLSVFWKSVHCSGRPYLYDGVIEISVRQPEGARIIKSTGRIVLGGSRWKVWRSCRKSQHTWSLDAFWMRWRFFLKGGFVEDVDGCWKSLRGYPVTTCAVGGSETPSKSSPSEGKSCLKRNQFQETPIRIAIYAISSRRTDRQRKDPTRTALQKIQRFKTWTWRYGCFRAKTCIETAPRERAKVGENRKGRDVRSWRCSWCIFSLLLGSFLAPVMFWLTWCI